MELEMSGAGCPEVAEGLAVRPNEAGWRQCDQSVHELPVSTIQLHERLRHRAIAPCLELLFVDGVHIIGDPNERAETHLVFRQGFLAIRNESGRGGTDLVPARKVRDEIADAPTF